MKALKILSITILVPIFLVFLLLVSIRFEPNIIFSTTAYQAFKRVIKIDSLKIDDEHLVIHSSSHSFNQKKINLKAKAFCVYIESSVDLCFDDLEIDAIVDLGFLIPSLVHIDLLKSKSKKFRFISSEEKKDQTSKPFRLSEVFPEFLKKTTFGKVLIQMEDVSFSKDQNKASFDVILENSHKNEQTHWEIDLEMDFFEKNKRHQSKATVIIVSKKDHLFPPVQAEVKTNLNLPGINSYQVSAALKSFDPGRYTYNLQSNGSIEGVRHSIQTDGKTDLNWFSGKLQASSDLNSKPLRNVEGKKCSYEIKDEIKTNCIIDAFFIFNKKVRKLSLLLDAQYLDQSSFVANLDLDSTELEMIGLDGSVKFSGNKQEDSGWSYLLDLDLDGKIDSFQKVVQATRGTSYSIYSPFDVLEGKVFFKSKGQVDFQKKSIPIELGTDLSSNKQKFNISSNGKIGFIQKESRKDKILEIYLDVNLNQVELVLPNLSLQEPAKIVADPRITDKKIVKSKKEKSNVRLFLNIKTNSSKPVLVHSNLTKEMIPVSVDLKVDPEKGAAGGIHVNRVSLELFNRDAHLDYFKFKLDENSGYEKIDGKISVQYADYTIYISLLGTTDKPIVRLSSDPPLPEDALVATLIFGRPVDALDDEQASSVNETRAALADQAIGLASLYLLASTPVERVNYNPSSKKVTAKVRLGNRTSLHLGRSSGEGGSNEIGIKKRLEKHWIISTDYIREGTNSSKKSRASAFIEWVNRY